MEDFAGSIKGDSRRKNIKKCNKQANIFINTVILNQLITVKKFTQYNEQADSVNIHVKNVSLHINFDVESLYPISYSSLSLSRLMSKFWNTVHAETLGEGFPVTAPKH